MPCQIFVDESGDISFSPISDSKYFVITCLVLDEEQRKSVKNTVRNRHADLYRIGWPKGVEIKASVLHSINLPQNRELASKLTQTIDGDAYIEKVLLSLKNACTPTVHCIAVNKKQITSQSLRRAEYGIAYNYFAKELLLPIVLDKRNCEIIIDQRNKETHPKKHFDEYIRSTIIGEAFSRGIEVQFTIAHLESHRAYGLQAVDYFCWAVNRYIAKGQRRFFEVFRENVGIFKKWYI